AARHERSPTLASRTVSHLIVVLQADHMSRRGNVFSRRTARAPVPELRRFALKHKSFVECADDLFRAAEILVIALALTGKEGMDRMVEIVTPQSIQSVAVLGRRTNNFLVILIGFRDDAYFAAKLCGQQADMLLNVGENVLRRIVDDGLHSVQAQC